MRRVGSRHAAPASEPAERSVPAREAVRAARAEAAQDWSAAIGPATSCALAKDGRSHPAAKFHEGRTAALGELLRACPDDASSDDVAALAAANALDWTTRALPGAGRGDWESYRAGALEVLRGIADA
ncbi:hypothetical protein [Agromyces sp. SYSU T0242]|uniref:hypothetical protein n=1 Tax=Agromyces litoreus TaxID=3158561 RepID=UPI00339A0B8B